MHLLEAVPNVSEGRDLGVVEAVGRAFSTAARLLDVHSDADHHRSVFTLVGSAEMLVEGLLAGAERAVELVDLRAHEGVHPRIGAVDVVPLVPLRVDEMPLALEAALRVAERIGSELGLPVFLYAESAGGVRPAHFRRGGAARLQRRIDSGELTPDYGPRRMHPSAGAVLVGARRLLVAFNLELTTDDVRAANAIAAAVRESSGGLPGVQALGLWLAGASRAQVSLNIVDVERTHLADVVAAVRREAASLGVEVLRGEIVGLLPEACVTAPAELALESLPDELVLERRLAMTTP